jgi:hypothetical protein
LLDKKYPYIEEIDGYTVEFLDPKVLVFKNAIKNGAEVIKYYEENIKEWAGWYGFGTQVADSGPGLPMTDHFPTRAEWDKQILLSDGSEKSEIINSINTAFYEASKIYVDAAEPAQTTWAFPNWNLAKYVFDEVISNEDRTMNWHADFQDERAEEPGEKFGITMVIYPNDDYEGGEISFRVFSPTETEFEEKPLYQIDYKPSAGDIVFFPSAHPYYHGVLRIYKAAKYIIRGYWKFDYPGSDYWHSLVEKYGDRLEELEKERLKRHDFLVTDPVQRERYPLHMYYDLLEAGKLPEEYIRKTGCELPE